MSTPETAPAPASAGDMAGIAMRGFAMGSADVVPGVSGGTVALLTGIYPRLVATISAGSRTLGRFLRGDFSDGWASIRLIDWSFLGALGLGAAIAVVTLARVIEDLLASQPTRMAGLFLGLIAGTIVIAWRMLQFRSAANFGLAIVVGAAAFALFGLQSSTVTNPSLLIYLGAGAVAICAFILPGISGSFLLLSIGMYQAVLGVVNDRSMAEVGVFALGAIIGLAVFSRVLDRLLERHFDPVLAVLIGLMLGSFRILWPWPNGLGDENGVGATALGAPSGDVAWPICLAIGAAVMVVGVSRRAERPAD